MVNTPRNVRLVGLVISRSLGVVILAFAIKELPGVSSVRKEPDRATL